MEQTPNTQSYYFYYVSLETNHYPLLSNLVFSLAKFCCAVKSTSTNSTHRLNCDQWLLIHILVIWICILSIDLCMYYITLQLLLKYHCVFNNSLCPFIELALYEHTNRLLHLLFQMFLWLLEWFVVSFHLWQWSTLGVSCYQCLRVTNIWCRVVWYQHGLRLVSYALRYWTCLKVLRQLVKINLIPTYLKLQMSIQVIPMIFSWNTSLAPLS